MIKNIMGAAVAVALAAGVGTTGVSSNTTYKKPTQIIAAAKTTTLTDYHSNTEFTKSSDTGQIIFLSYHPEIQSKSLEVFLIFYYKDNFFLLPGILQAIRSFFSCLFPPLK